MREQVPVLMFLPINLLFMVGWSRGTLPGLILSPHCCQRIPAGPWGSLDFHARLHPGKTLNSCPWDAWEMSFLRNLYENGGHTLPCRGDSFLWGIQGFFSLWKWFEIAFFGNNIFYSCAWSMRWEFLLNHHFDINKLANNYSKPKCWFLTSV